MFFLGGLSKIDNDYVYWLNPKKEKQSFDASTKLGTDSQSLPPEFRWCFFHMNGGRDRYDRYDWWSIGDGFKAPTRFLGSTML